MERSSTRGARPSSCEYLAGQARPVLPAVRRTVAAGHQAKLADVSGGVPVRPWVRYGVRDWPAGHDRRRCHGQPTGSGRAVATHSVHRGDVRHGHHRRRSDDQGLRLGAGQPATSDLLQHQHHLAVGAGRPRPGWR